MCTTQSRVPSTATSARRISRSSLTSTPIWSTSSAQRLWVRRPLIETSFGSGQVQLRPVRGQTRSTGALPAADCHLAPFRGYRCLLQGSVERICTSWRESDHDPRAAAPQVWIADLLPSPHSISSGRFGAQNCAEAFRVHPALFGRRLHPWLAARMASGPEGG